MPYLTAAQLRSRVKVLDNEQISDEDLEDLVEEFEDKAERYTGVAYLPREVTTTVEVCGTRWISPHFLITAVSSCEIDDVAVTPTFYDGYALEFPSYRRGLMVVTYTHGMTEPPKAILRACREYVTAKAMSDRSGVPRDAYVSDVEGVTYRLSTPDWNARRPTGYIEVDDLLNSVEQYRLPGVA